MVDWAGHYRTIYNVLGVDATITIAETGSQHALTVIDKTSGEPGIDRSGVIMVTIRPECAVRASELQDEGIDLTKLIGSAITFNGVSWRVENKRSAPSPEGEMSGEIYLLLTENGNG